MYIQYKNNFIRISFVTHTIIRVFILRYSYIYMSSCTYILMLCYIHLYEYLYLGILTII